jgi:membrane dipeptidase
VGCSTCTVYVPPPPLRLGAWAACVRILDRLDEQLLKNGGAAIRTDTAEAIRRAHRNGLLAALPAVEGGHVIGGRLERVEQLRQRGVRLLTLTHFVANRICDASIPPMVHGGLSDFGREAIRACQEHGVVVDLSHASEKAFYDALEVLDRPVAVSHTALRFDRRNERYLTEDQVRAVGHNGGVIGVILWPWYLKNSVFGGLHLALDQYARIAELIGPEHLMLGSDMDAFTWLPRPMRDASDWPVFTAGLLKRGFSEDEVAGIIGLNALRLLEAWESSPHHADGEAEARMGDARIKQRRERQ